MYSLWGSSRNTKHTGSLETKLAMSVKATLTGFPGKLALPELCVFFLRGGGGGGVCGLGISGLAGFR